MIEAGLTGVNLSLDTLDPHKYQIITRRKGQERVLRVIEKISELNQARPLSRVELKVNCVVIRGLNDDEIIPFVRLAKHREIQVRFIEYMPFAGNRWMRAKMVPYQEILTRISSVYPGLERIKPTRANETSKNFHIPGFKGQIGFITSMTEHFCNTCNRLRITSDGKLKVCLFGREEVSLRDIIRDANGGKPLNKSIFSSLLQPRQRTSSSQESSPGAESQLLPHTSSHGLITLERNLLEMIGQAVKKKKEKHAGMESLKAHPNRPMILIGG